MLCSRLDYKDAKSKENLLISLSCIIIFNSAICYYQKGEIAILAGSVMDTLNTVGATYLKNGPKPKTTTQKNNDHDKPPYYPPPTALFLGIYTPAADASYSC